MFAHSYLEPIRKYLGHRWRGANLGVAIDDAVQDVFVECFKPDGALVRANQQHGEFRALLYAVVRNVARRHEERAARQGHGQGGSVYLDDLPDRAEALSQYFDRTWAEAIVRDAILRHARAARRGEADMRLRYRILRLRHQEGLSIRHIATQLAQPDVDAVHNAYRRARREFRHHMREATADHTGAGPDALDAECRRISSLLGS